MINDNSHTIKTPFCQALAVTDLGKVRSHNEDRYLLQAWSDTEAILAVVADGIGGNSSGEIAAQMAVDTFAELLEQPLPLTEKEQYETLLKQCYLADERIRSEAVTSFQTLGMGTTIVAAIITPKTCLHVHAGDSRLYHFCRGKIAYQTIDHSIIQMLLEAGKVKPENIYKHPLRSVLSSNLGGQNAAGDFSVDPKWNDEQPPIIYLEPDDTLLLCSDGLNNFVSEADMETLVNQYPDSMEQLNQALLQSALQQGGGDNITILSIKLLP